MTVISVMSGQKAVTTAGTAVALGSGDVFGPLLVKALAGNGGMIYVGNDGAGDVTSANGFELDAGEEIYFDYVTNLNRIMLDTSNNGDAVCYIILKS